MNKTPVSVYVILSLLLAILLLSGVVFYQKKKIVDLTSQINSKDKTDLGGGVTKSGSSPTDTGTIIQHGKDDGVPIDVIKKDADNSGSKITGINDTKTDSKGQNTTNLPSTRVTPIPEPFTPPKPPEPVACPNTDPFGYSHNIQYLSVQEDFGTQKVPFGEVGFNSTVSKPWSVNVHPRTYHSVVVLAEDENFKKSAYSTFSVETDGTRYVLPISSSKLEFSYPVSHLSWNPRLMMGLSLGASFPLGIEWGPSIGITAASYGKYLASPDWYFGALSFGYEVEKANPTIQISPFLYRISNFIPFTQSLYLGPEIGMDLQGRLLVSAGFKLGF
jgi:hypothetical protein